MSLHWNQEYMSNSLFSLHLTKAAVEDNTFSSKLNGVYNEKRANETHAQM